MKKLFLSSFVATSVLAGIAPVALANPHSFRFSARDCWVNTGIHVNSGDEIDFQASGQWRDGGSPAIGPSGVGRFFENAESSSAPFGALIGKVGNGQPFLVGSHSSQEFNYSGPLYLSVNDFSGTCSNNSGSFNVRVNRQSNIDRTVSDTLRDAAGTAAEVENIVNGVEDVVEGLDSIFNIFN
jgi:hypothetical protein